MVVNELRAVKAKWLELVRPINDGFVDWHCASDFS